MSYHELDTPEITIRREGEEPIALNLIGWNNDYTKLYLRGKNGLNKVLPIVHLSVSWNIPEEVELKPTEWREPMFPNSDPVSIVPTHLLPPPCRSKYVGLLNPQNEINKATELEALYNDYAHPNKSDLAAIKRDFNKLQKEKKKTFFALGKAEREKNKIDFQAVGIDGETKFIWELTPDDEIETNATGTRDRRLIKRWLKEKNLKPEEMSEALERFKIIIRLKIKIPNRKGIRIEPAMDHLIHQVHYKIIFSSGSEFWLFEVNELRAPRSKKETKEIKTLALELPKIYTPQEAAKMVGCSLVTIGRYCKDLKVSKAKITDDVISLFKTEKKKRSKRTIINPHKSDDRYS
jgi:hypothetical protein